MKTSPPPAPAPLPPLSDNARDGLLTALNKWLCACKNTVQLAELAAWAPPTNTKPN
jgi:hypothetical protein